MLLRGASERYKLTSSCDPLRMAFTSPNLQLADLTTRVEQFLASQPEDSATGGRARSFDHCWNYFQRTPLPTEDMEKSCHILGFYLASWGMYRGSTYLFRSTSAAHLQPVIEYIEDNQERLRGLDLSDYGEEGRDSVIDSFRGIREALHLPDGTSYLILTTKVIVGTVGFLPAFDRYFVDGIRSLYGRARQPSFSQVDIKSLTALFDIYTANKGPIDALAAKTVTNDFTTGEPTTVNATRAKVLDMYGFQRGYRPD